MFEICVNFKECLFQSSDNLVLYMSTSPRWRFLYLYIHYNITFYFYMIRIRKVLQINTCAGTSATNCGSPTNVEKERKEKMRHS